jgi:DNA-directed RNA polymerase specialized sigma subunit, sigma54 homolog
MAFETKLTQEVKLRLQQRLVITPQLRQAIKILQLPRGELDALIDEELAENPLVDRAEEDEKGTGRASLKLKKKSRRPTPLPLATSTGRSIWGVTMRTCLPCLRSEKKRTMSVRTSWKTC